MRLFPVPHAAYGAGKHLAASATHILPLAAFASSGPQKSNRIRTEYRWTSSLRPRYLGNYGSSFWSQATKSLTCDQKGNLHGSRSHQSHCQCLDALNRKAKLSSPEWQVYRRAPTALLKPALLPRLRICSWAAIAAINKTLIFRYFVHSSILMNAFQGNVT